MIVKWQRQKLEEDIVTTTNFQIVKQQDVEQTTKCYANISWEIHAQKYRHVEVYIHSDGSRYQPLDLKHAQL